MLSTRVSGNAAARPWGKRLSRCRKARQQQIGGQCRNWLRRGTLAGWRAMPGPEPAAPPKLKRRWFQYSISTLLLLILVGVGLGLVCEIPPCDNAAPEIRAERRGTVTYATRSLKVWLCNRRWGADYFRTVERVDLPGLQVKDDDLVHLKALVDLKLLNFAAPRQSVTPGWRISRS